MKNKYKIFCSIFALIISITVLYTFYYNPTIDGVTLYKNPANIEIDEAYKQEVRNLAYKKGLEDPDTAVKLANYWVKLNSAWYGKESIETAYSYIEKANMLRILNDYNILYDCNENAINIAEKLDNIQLKNAAKLNWIFYYFSVMEYQKAKEIMDTINVNDLNDDELINLYKQYADTYNNLGEFAKATDSLSKYYEKSKAEYGKKSNNSIVYYTSLINTLSKMFGQNYNLIKTYYDNAMMLNQEESLYNVNNISSNVFQIAEYYKEYKLHKKGLEILDKYFPEISKSENINAITTIYNEYFEYYKDMKDFDNAYIYLQKIEEIYENYPDNFSDELSLYNQRIDYYQGIGNFDKENEIKDQKLTFLKKDLNKAEKYRNVAPIIYAHALKNYADGLYKREDFETKESYYKNLIEIYKDVIAENSYSLASIYKDFADKYKDVNKIDNAIEYYNKSLDLYNKYAGTINKNSAEIYSNLAFLYSSKNDIKNAIKNIEKSEYIYKRIFGKNNVTVYEKLLNNYFFNLGVNRKKAEFIFNRIIIADKYGKIQGNNKEFYFNLYIEAARKYKKIYKKKSMEYFKKAEILAMYDWQKEQLKEFNSNN